MKKKIVSSLVIGVLIGVIGSFLVSDQIREAWAVDWTNFTRIVLGTSNQGIRSMASSTADIQLQHDEYITNYSDGTIGFGAANLSTTGTLDVGAATVSSLILGSQAHQEYTVKATITTAEVLALHATPDTLILAPGANKAIIFLDAIILLDYNSAAYAGVDATEDLVISYTDGSGEVVAEIETTGFIDQTNDELRYVSQSAGADGDDNAYIIPVANKPLCLSLLVGEITTGTSPIDIVIHYKVVATNL